MGAPIQSGIVGLLLFSTVLAAGPGADEQVRLLERANASYAGRRPLEAVHLYREYLARYPDRADVRVFLGAALLNLDKPEEALEETRRALTLNKTYSRAYTLAGRIYAGGHDWELAQQAFADALRLNPRDRETWYFSGRAYYDETRFEKAVEAFQAALAIGADDSRVCENLGLADEALGRFAQAEQAYQRATQLAAGAYRPYLTYGVFLDKQGRPAESIEMLQKALALEPENVDVRFELGKALYQSRQLAAAAQILEPALASSNQCRVHYLLISVYAQQQKTTEADRQLKALENCRNEPRRVAAVAVAVGALVFAQLFAQRGSVDAPIEPIVFQNVAAASGIHFVLKNSASAEKYQIETMPAGVAVLDYNNDGFEDIYFVNGATVPGLTKKDASYWNRLYRNNGDGTFTDVTAKAGVAGVGYSMAASVGDYDNDGWDDLFVAGVNRNILYHNNGDGTFTDTTQKAGLGEAAPAKPWSISAGWFDYDNDGWLDLFVVNYVKWAPGQDPYCGEKKPGYRAYCDPRLYQGLPNALYHNNRDGTFTDVSAVSGIGSHVGKGMAVAFADYDGDWLMDAFVTNDSERNFLFHNDGNGRFSEVGIRAGVAYNIDGKAVSSMGVDFRDLSGTGRPDLVTTALSNESFSLFRNIGKGLFMDASYQSGLTALSLPWAGWGVGLFDLNNDGAKDIFTANASARDNEELYGGRAYRQPNSVFANAGSGRFMDSGATAGTASRQAAHRGCAFGDFDNDGRVDVVVSSLNEPAEILRNVSSRRQHWFDVLLTGRRSNRDAIGAVVRVTSAAGKVQYNHVTTAVGYASSSSRRVHFGLGAERGIKTVQIRWPSGAIQELEQPKADQCLRITEPE